jgi:hypothetical protein
LKSRRITRRRFSDVPNKCGRVFAAAKSRVAVFPESPFSGPGGIPEPRHPGTAGGRTAGPPQGRPKAAGKKKGRLLQNNRPCPGIIHPGKTVRPGRNRRPPIANVRPETDSFSILLFERRVFPRRIHVTSSPGRRPWTRRRRRKAPRGRGTCRVSSWHEAALP